MDLDKFPITIEPLSPTLEASKMALAGQLAPSSKRIYEEAVNLFAEWLEERDIPLDLITYDNMVEYRVFIASKPAKGKEGKIIKETTAARLFSIACRVVEVAAQRGIYGGRNPIEGISGFKTGVDETPHRVLTYVEAQTLLESIDTSTLLGVRDYILIDVLFRTGIRRAEASGLTLADMQSVQGHTIISVLGKGNKRRPVKLMPEVSRKLLTYLERLERTESKPTDPIFVPLAKNHRPYNRPLSTRTIGYIVHRRAVECTSKYDDVDIANLTPHGLRATFITIALSKGAALYKVQYAVGHNDPRTTERYQKDKINLDDNAADYIKPN